MTTVYLIPRGKPDNFCAWANSRPRGIALERETDTAWHGKPLANPACPSLEYPKFAWESVTEPKMTTRFYVGKSGKSPRGEVFKLDHKPTEADNLPYGYCVGPFVTKRAALWACQYGAHWSTIAEAERAAKRDAELDFWREESEFMRQQWASNNLD